MVFYVKDANTWKQVNKTYVKDANTWKQVKKAWVKDAGVWKPFFVSEITREYMGIQAPLSSSSSFNFTGYGVDGADAGKFAVAVIGTFNGSGTTLPSSVSIGGSVATKLAGEEAPSNYDVDVSIWGVTLGGSPTDSVSVTFGASYFCGATLYLLENASTTPYNSNTNFTSATTIASTIDTISGGSTISGLMLRGPGAVGPYASNDGGLTEDAEQLIATSGFGGFYSVSRSPDTDATNELITFTSTQGSDLMSLVTVSFEPG